MNNWPQDKLPYLELTYRFEQCLLYLSSLTHSRCPTVFDRPHHVPHGMYGWRPGHNSGYLWEMMGHGPKLPREIIEAWIEDHEHGLLHGIFTAFAGLYLAADKHPCITETYGSNGHGMPPTREARFLVASLLHDLARYVPDSLDDTHDALLFDLINGLPDATYRHHTPHPKDVDTPLVRGDRLELMRYDDWQDWVDTSIYDYLDATKRKMIDLFYGRLRPALLEAWAYRDDPWVRHGLEFPLKSSRVQLYPPRWETWPRGEQNKDMPYCVEISELSFDRAFLCSLDRWCPTAITPLWRAIEAGGTVAPFPRCGYGGRDHATMDKPLPPKAWTLIYGPDPLLSNSERRGFSDLYPHMRGPLSFTLVHSFIATAKRLATMIRAMRAEPASLRRHHAKRTAPVSHSQPG